MLKVLKTLGILYLILGGCLLFAQLLAFSARLVLFPMGFIFLLGGAVCLLYRAYRIRRAQRLKVGGVCITARVIRFCRDRMFRMNGRYPHYLLCEAQDPFGAGMRTFRSESIWIKLPDHFAVNSPVTVYIDPQHPRRYYVDLQAALPYPVS